MSNATAMKKINDALSESFFDVREEQLVTESGLVVPDKKVICASDTGRPLAVVGSGYKTVTNEEIFTGFTHILADTKLNLDGAHVELDMSHGGARTFAQIVLPNHKIAVGPKDDETAFRIIAKNSYDGSTSFSVQAGGYRYVCSNGMVTGTSLGFFTSKHIASLDVSAAADNIAQVLDTFTHSKKWFESLRKKKVNDEQAYACLAFASRNVEASRVGFVKYEDMPRGMKTLMDSWSRHKKELGDNAWALYNTMTHFSTHWGEDKEDKHANAAAARFRREDRVRETLSSRIWERAIAA